MNKSIINKIRTDKRGATGLLLSIVILTAILSVTLAANEIVRHGIYFSWQQLHSTKAYFAAEGGLEQLLYATRKRYLSFSDCNSGDCIQFTAGGEVATTTGTSNITCDPTCLVDVERTFANGAGFYLRYTNSSSATVATSSIISFGNYRDDINRTVQVTYIQNICVGPGCASSAYVSCRDILDNGASTGDGFYWINPTGSHQFQVWCDMTGGGWIELAPSNGPHGHGLFMCSYSAVQPATICGVLPGWVYDSNTAVGDVVGDTGNTCLNSFTWRYESGFGNILSSEEVYQISRVIAQDGSVEKNFDIYTSSCDDDALARPNGHWNGFGDYIGGGEYYDDCTSGNNAYCNSVVDSATAPFDSWPLPLSICCSVDGTGGGVFTGFNSPTLRVR